MNVNEYDDFMLAIESTQDPGKVMDRFMNVELRQNCEHMATVYLQRALKRTVNPVDYHPMFDGLQRHTDTK